MAPPQFLFQLRVKHEQFPCGSSLQDPHHIHDAHLRFGIHQQMDMIRHDFHGQDRKPVFLRDLQKDRLAVLIDTIGQYTPSVFGAPYEVILQGINISSTMS